MNLWTLNRSNDPQPGTVTLPLAEYHATQIALDGAIDRIDELQKADDQRATILCRQVDVIAERTRERDSARRWAVHLEQETADLTDANRLLRATVDALTARLEWHHRGTLPGALCQGCDHRDDPDEIEGVPA